MSSSNLSSFAHWYIHTFRKLPLVFRLLFFGLQVLFVSYTAHNWCHKNSPHSNPLAMKIDISRELDVRYCFFSLYVCKLCLFATIWFLYVNCTRVANMQYFFDRRKLHRFHRRLKCSFLTHYVHKFCTRSASKFILNGCVTNARLLNLNNGEHTNEHINRQ